MIAKKILILFFMLLVTLTIPVGVYTQEASITVTENFVTANDAPQSSTLLVALYNNEQLVAVKTYEGNGTIKANFREDMAESIPDATNIKAFLWNLANLYPICGNISSELNKLSTDNKENKILIAYFSCTGTTEDMAHKIADKTGADIYGIAAAVPYTEEDLKYYTDCRADKEQADPNARPAIANSISNMEQYDTIFLGYPIWHGQAPKIIYTFLESYDFSGKTIITFNTHGGSGFSTR